MNMRAVLREAAGTQVESMRVHADALRLRYGEVEAVGGVSLAIESGEFVSLLGPSGCGKSSILRAIAGLVPVAGGELRIAGGPPGEGAGLQIGMMFQKPLLLPWRTTLENVQLPVEIAMHSGSHVGRVERQLAMDLLRIVGLADFADAYPHQLSGGMQQRVAIAQALLMHPPVLLLDEAFSALDPSTRASLQEQLKAVWLESKPTVIFVTHNTSEALLLGTRLILLGRHREDRAGETNLLLDLEIPSSQLPHSARVKSREFQELLEHVKGLAYKFSSLCADDADPDSNTDSNVEEGALG
jgi:NitT/TauT family transport system ATP-binding protein